MLPARARGPAAAAVGLATALFTYRRLSRVAGAGPPASAARTVLDAPWTWRGEIPASLGPRTARLVLGARAADSEREVERKYRALACANHPDRGGSPALSKLIGEAYGVLSRDA